MLKLFGLGAIFWLDQWNLFDLLIIVLSVGEAIISVASTADTPGISSLRLLRIFRIIRLLGMFERLSTLVSAFIGALIQVMWVGILILILIYIFAVLGHGFFANNPKLYANPDYDQELFANMPRTLLTLFQLMTMDDWANMMRPVGNTMPFSWLYTMPFVFLGICLMNLVPFSCLQSINPILSQEPTRVLTLPMNPAP